MKNQVLWLKYRPTKWDDIIGQEQIVQSFKNCLQQNKIPNAFLFYGIRGIGKTTIARILARCLSCTNTDNLSEPCGKCNSCMNFANHIDVTEVDGASKTSIEDIKQLIEACQYTPTQGRYKIFIIDEVHMLSKSAFNALLKTLEEPPAHVKFIFATTELQKVPDTILSRCIVFNLKPINKNIMVEYLENIAKKEDIKLESGVSNILAETAEGSVRDALSLLEQAIMIKNDIILQDDVLKMIGLATQEDTNLLLNLFWKGETEKVLAKVTQLMQNGVEAVSFFKQIQTMVYEKITKNVKTQHLEKLLQIWDILVKQSENLQNCFNPEIILNATLVILSEEMKKLRKAVN